MRTFSGLWMYTDNRGNVHEDSFDGLVMEEIQSIMEQIDIEGAKLVSVSFRLDVNEFDK